MPQARRRRRPRAEPQGAPHPCYVSPSKPKPQAADGVAATKFVLPFLTWLGSNGDMMESNCGRVTVTALGVPATTGRRRSRACAVVAALEPSRGAEEG